MILVRPMIPTITECSETPTYVSDLNMATASNIVFDDLFTINAIDREGKKFDRGLS